MKMLRLVWVGVLLLLVGCGLTTSTVLDDIDSITPKVTPQIESSVSKSFRADAPLLLVTNNKYGRILNDMILGHWERQDYISNHEYVKLENFSGTAEYNLTLGGTFDLDENVGLGIISGLTLMIIPDFLTFTYDLEYTLTNVKTGQVYKSKIHERKEEMKWLLFVVIFPISWYQQINYTDMIAEHVYQDFVKQGAFQ
jgi:hypothetical protein